VALVAKTLEFKYCAVKVRRGGEVMAELTAD
jgi:hypothetical protein